MVTENYSECPPLLQDYFFYMLTIRGKSERTVYGYFLDLRMFLRFCKIRKNGEDLKNLEEVDIQDLGIDFFKEISMSDAYAFLQFLSADRDNSNRTRSRKVSAIKGFFKYLSTKTNLGIENPFVNLEMPNIKKSLPKHLSLEESVELLNAIEGEYRARDYCIATLFLNCGLRLSELCSLNLKDIKDNSMRVLGKGNKERIIYLNSACEEAILEHLKSRPDIDGQGQALFLSRNNRRISRRRVQQIIDEALRAAGLDDMGYSVHKLRHTAATLMYQHGDVDIRVLKEILGHESISTTEIYTHVSNSQMEKAANKSPLANVKYKKKP